MKKSTFLFASAVICTINLGSSLDAKQLPFQNASLSVDTRVEDLLGRLTLEEKASLMSGGSYFNTKEIERLGIPKIWFSDGPAGVRDLRGRSSVAYPVGVGLGSTWNPQLVEEVGAAMGRDAKKLNISVLLGPNVNIQRTPLAGRNFEAYSEDPYLSGMIGAGFVKGVQREGVGASIKHFVGNEQELERMRGSSNIDARTLREIYLRPFEIVVKEADPWTVMCSYNRLNGTYLSANKTMLTDVLKYEWGFQGLVMSDWGAVHETVGAANAGLDLEMPGPPKFFGPNLVEAVNHWLVEENTVDEAARRILRLIVKSGALDEESGRVRGTEYSLEENRQMSREVAEEGIVLLQNRDNLLPLAKEKLKRIAVIGPNADIALIGGGGSSQVIPTQLKTPLEALEQYLQGSGVEIEYAKGVDNDKRPPFANAKFMSPTLDRKDRGLKASYYASEDFSGDMKFEEIDTRFKKMGFGAAVLVENPKSPLSVRWEGYFWPPESGDYEFEFSGYGRAKLKLDGEEVLSWENDMDTASTIDVLEHHEGASSRVVIEKNKPVKMVVEYVKKSYEYSIFNFSMRCPAGTIAQAEALAKKADVALVFVGTSTTSESEGYDREDMKLYGDQNLLVEKILAANPNTVVVLYNGAPLEMPWCDRAPAILEAWYPGQEGNDALTRILFGEVNPSGKLAQTLPVRIEDNPTYIHYSGGRDANYGEGVFVGYRYYEKKKINPQYAFGHGLSYTTFEYENLEIPGQVPMGETVKCSVEIMNTGKIAGKEVVQVYVGDVGKREVSRPVKELRAFEKVNLKPGELKTVHFELNPRDFSYYDVHLSKWVCEVGDYQILVGSASDDIRVQGEVRIVER